MKTKILITLLTMLSFSGQAAELDQTCVKELASIESHVLHFADRVCDKKFENVFKRMRSAGYSIDQTYWAPIVDSNLKDINRTLNCIEELELDVNELGGDIYKLSRGNYCDEAKVLGVKMAQEMGLDKHVAFRLDSGITLLKTLLMFRHHRGNDAKITTDEYFRLSNYVSGLKDANFSNVQNSDRTIWKYINKPE